MGDPILDHDALDECLRLVAGEAARYLAAIDEAPVRPPGEAAGIDGPLPEEGAGSLAALRTLIDAADAGATRSAGPRFFHFVMGGGTPAALAADWLAGALDQIAFNWASSPLAMRLEQVSLGWLKELFGLPAAWSGVLTTGATTANLTGLAAARRWWGLEHGVDVEEQGLSGLPPLPVLTSGFVHASALKALAMLGIGRAQVRTFAADATGRLDVAALDAALRGLGGAPAVDRRDRRRGEHGRVRPARGDGRPGRASTARGCTSTPRSGSSPPSRPRRASSSPASSARTRSASTGTSG